MIIKYNYLILLLMLSIGFSARPTFINIQTVNGIISYPTIVSVSETHVILVDGSEIKMENINSVLAYGEAKSFFPCLIGAGCGYLGLFPGCLIAILIFPTSMAQGDNQIGASMIMYGTAILSGYYAYRRASIRASKLSQTMVFMGGWTMAQKRNFFISAIPPG